MSFSAPGSIRQATIGGW